MHAYPTKCCGGAIMTATYLQNILPIKDTTKAPFELWHGRVPSVKHITVSGSLANKTTTTNNTPTYQNRKQL